VPDNTIAPWKRICIYETLDESDTLYVGQYEKNKYNLFSIVLHMIDHDSHNVVQNLQFRLLHVFDKVLCSQ